MIKRLCFLGVLALAAGATVRVMTATAPASATPAAALTDKNTDAPSNPALGGDNLNGRPHWQSVWTRPTPHARFISLSGDGQSVAWVDDKGSVRRLNAATGATQWQTPPLPGINRVLAIPGALGGVVAYAFLNPASPAVRILDAHSGIAQARTFTVSGAVWEAQASPDGKNVVVGTGKSFLYVLPVAAPPPLILPSPPPAPSSKPGKRGGSPLKPTPAPSLPADVPPVKVQVQGIPENMDVAQKEPVAVAGTWQESGVCAWGLDGTPKWRHDDREPDRTYQVHLSADGGIAVATSTKGPNHTDARLHAWDARTGRLLWNADLAAASPKALVSATGQFIAVTYARVDDSGAEAGIGERKLALFDRTGKRLFSDKGGLFFAPELVALSSDGTRLTVRDKSGYLYTLDNRGHMVGRVRLAVDPDTGVPPTIRDTQTSRDGRFLLVMRGDGQMTLFKSAP